MAVDLNSLSTITQWKPNSKHVDQSIQEGISTSSANILMAVGPSRMSEITGSTGYGPFLEGLTRTSANVVSVGAVGSASVSQSRPTKVVFEIGSKLQYNVPTNVSGSISLSRVFLNGASLMKALYSFKSDADMAELEADNDSPGDLNSGLWINMASSLFDQPIGILFWVKDNKKRNVGAYYFENCSVQGLSFSLYAGGGVFSEGTQIIFDTVKPVKLSSYK